MMQIIQALLPVALKILGMYFDKIQTEQGQKEAYLAFIQSMQKKQGQPADLSLSYDAQVDRLKKMIEAEKAKEVKP